MPSKVYQLTFLSTEYIYIISETDLEIIGLSETSTYSCEFCINISCKIHPNIKEYKCIKYIIDFK